MKAKPGKEAAVEAFLKEALPLANEESGTTVWFAIKLDSSTFGIFDGSLMNLDVTLTSQVRSPRP